MAQEKKGRNKREPNTLEVFFPIVSMIIILFVGRVIMNISMTALLVVASLVGSVIAYRVGATWDDMFAGISKKMQTGLGALILLVFVGAMLGLMEASGTIPMLIYYGVQIVSGPWLMATAFILCCLVSVATGTSWGSIATIGVTTMGIAMGLGVSPLGVAGAVIGGSWFGDKLSPLSDTTNLTAAASGTDLFDHIRQMLWTTIPASLIALLVYVIVGFSSDVSGTVSSDTLTGMLTQLDSMFNWNILLLLPLVVILVGAALKYPAIPMMIAASIVAGLEAIIFQGITVTNVFNAMMKGFNTSMVTNTVIDAAAVMPEVTRLLHRGGMNSMLGTVLLIMAAFAFAGILESAGCLKGMLDRVAKRVKSDSSLLVSTVFSCLGVATITNNFVSSVVLGEMYQDLYRERGLDTANLSRTLEDCGTCIIPLVPWSASGAYVVAMLGVAPGAFIPWAIFCWISPIISLFYAYTGISIKRLNPDETSIANVKVSTT
ncbi:MAG: Na+/H+ antiporter NhaC [Desulfotignum sp.]|nr:Na+/H+ antiporter NhaC [Desulfotignum sp.]